MEKKYVIRISSGVKKLEHVKNHLIDRGFTFEERAYGKSFCEMKICETDMKDWEKYCRKVGLKFVSIPVEYTRSNDYRKIFFVNNRPLPNGKYRCAYCGKQLAKQKVTVDHIFPVKKMSESKKVRRHAKTFGINGVNDVKNLCAACMRCNKRKSANMGLWTFRGFIGKSEMIWKIRILLRWIVIFSIIAGGMYLCNQNGTQIAW